MAAFYSKYPAVSISIPAGGATAANQVLEIAELTQINANTADAATETTLAALNSKVTIVDTDAVTIIASALPTGAATETTLQSIDAALSVPLAVTGPLTDAELRASPVPVSGTVSTGGLTDAELRASPVPISGTVTANAGTDLNTSALNLEATQSAFSAKSGSADVHEAYDYRSFSYVGATQKIDTIVYKAGGSGGTTVATQTFGYDGSDRLTSITKT